MGHILESELLSYPLDSDGLLRKKKAVKRVLLEQDIQWLDKRIAVLGGSTTNDIQDCLELFLLLKKLTHCFKTSLSIFERCGPSCLKGTDARLFKTTLSAPRTV